MSEFSALVESECLGAYRSARLTVLSVRDRVLGRNLLLFARICLQVGPPDQKSPLTKKYDLSSRFGYAITEYDVDLAIAEDIYNQAASGGNSLVLSGYTLYTDKSKEITRRYTGPQASNRENSFLSASSNGCYWIEFFNEDKRSVSVIYDPYRSPLPHRMVEEVRNRTGIDLEKAGDRLGNIIFQFPVSILTAEIQSLDFGRSVQIDFKWHIPEEAVPELYILVLSQDENSIVDSVIVGYNQTPTQQITIKLYDTGLKIRIVRKNPHLILYEWKCNCAQMTFVYATFTDNPPVIRSFVADDKRRDIELHFPNGAFNPIHRLYHSQLAIDRAGVTPAYRQFEDNQYEDAIAYIRELVQNTRSREIMMIDPYLRASDILNVLYFSTMYGRWLRAIGSGLSDHSKKVDEIDRSSLQGMTSDAAEKARTQTLIQEQRTILGKAENGKLGLNLEFRLQHGNHGIKFHDRFLLFPGYPQEQVEPAVYAIGTSFNSVGKSYHVISSLQGPQRIIDDFEKQWNRLSHQDCRVFRAVAGPYQLSDT